MPKYQGGDRKSQRIEAQATVILAIVMNRISRSKTCKVC